MERLTVRWTNKVYDTFDPVDVVNNEYSKINYNKILTKLGNPKAEKLLTIEIGGNNND